MKINYKQYLMAAGALCFLAALFQGVIGFFPSLSLYFGAPEKLVNTPLALICASLIVSALLVGSGLYALSGAGRIQNLPWLRQTLLLISGVFILRGVALVPEIMVLMGLLNAAIPVPTRFAVFSGICLLMGLIFIAGTIGGWTSFPVRSD